MVDYVNDYPCDKLTRKKSQYYLAVIGAKVRVFVCPRSVTTLEKVIFGNDSIFDVIYYTEECNAWWHVEFCLICL